MSLWEILQAVALLDKPVTDIPLYFFSLVGFLAVPSALGRWVWALPAWFVALNLFLLWAPPEMQPRNNPVVYLAFTQCPTIFFLADLIAGGKAAAHIAPIPLRAWLAWSMFRFMGLSFVLALFIGDLPPEFVLTTATGELFTAFGAVLLWVFYRPDNMAYRGLLLFWNAYGLTAALSTGIRMLMANPELPLLRLPYVIHRQAMGFPQAWLPFFWIPLSVIIHLSVFYKLYLEWNSAQAPATAVPEGSNS